MFADERGPSGYLGDLFANWFVRVDRTQAEQPHWNAAGCGAGTDEDDSVKTIRAAVEHGITLVDTAPAMGLAAPKKSSAVPSPSRACARASLSRLKPASNGTMEGFPDCRP